MAEIPGATVEVNGKLDDKGQNLFPPGFRWFLDPASDNLGILQGMEIRVFVMGIEVSDYVTQFDWSNNSSAESISPIASLRLSGNQETFSLTEDNVFNDRWKDQESDFRTSESIKHRLYKYKVLENVYDLQTKTSRWNLNPNSCIFHSGDTIRAFVKIPWTLQDIWQPIFNGYLNDPQITQQATNLFTLDVTCTTIADKLNKARVFINSQAPGLMAASLGSSGKAQRLPQFSDQVFQTSNVDLINLFSDIAQDSRNFKSFLFNTSIQSLLGYIFYGNDVSAKESSEQDDNQARASQQKKNSTEQEKIQAQRQIDELQGQIAVLKRKHRNFSALDPADSPRVKSLEGKIKTLESELEAKVKAQKASQENPANNQNRQGQNSGSGKVTKEESNREQILTPSGVLRKYGFGFLHPDLFIIEDFPITGETYVDDEIQPIVSDDSRGETTKPPTMASSYQKVWPAGPYNTIKGHYMEARKNHIHSGIDVTTGRPGEIQNKPLYAPVSGIITQAKHDASTSKGTGNAIELKGDDGYYQRFYHLASIGVSLNQKVNAGDIIGTIGGLPGVPGSGTSTGAHLHWEVSTASYKVGKGNYIDPKVWFNSGTSNSQTPSKTITPQPLSIDQVNRKIDEEMALRETWDSSSLDMNTEQEVMAYWHARCLFGFANGVPKQEDGSVYNVNDKDPEEYEPKELLNLAQFRPNAWLTYDEVTFIGNNSDWLGVYSPHGKAVAIAYKRPRTGFGINMGIGSTEIQDGFSESTTTTRAQILTGFLSAIDYRWWVTGNGDVIVDFPHYDLKPEDYGSWEHYLSIDGEIWNNSYKENFAEIPSIFIVRGGFGGLQSNLGDGAAISASMEIVYQLPTAMIRNGVKIQTFSYPHVRDQKKLAILGMVQINKTIANCTQLSMDALPPLLPITPNCPIYMGHQDAYGLVDSTSFSWMISNNQIKSNLRVEVSAIRVRMTPEQAFIEEMMVEEEENYKNELEILKMDSSKSAQEKNTKLESLKKNKHAGSEAYQEKWQDKKDSYKDSTRKKYKHIQGQSSLILDYRKVCQQNLKNSDKYRASGSGAIIDAPQPRLISSPSLGDIQSNRTSTLKNLGDGIVLDKKVPIQPSSSTQLFTQPKVLEPKLQEKFDGHFKEGIVNPQAQEAILKHTNIVSGAQPDFLYYNLDGTPNYDMGMGLMGLKDSTLEQLEVKPAGIVSSMKVDPNLSNVDKMVVSQESIKNHPYLDPDYSIQMGIANTKQLDRIVGDTNLNPTLYGYALQRGPKDRALQETLKEVNTKDLSKENSQRITSNLQKWSAHYGNPTKRDQCYPSVFNDMRLG